MNKESIAGSLTTFLRLSLQNMLTLVSVNLMLFLDRIILARHSIESLNAAVTAGAICNIFIFGAIAIVGVADVLIGQCFGAGRTEKIGEILWQMVWFSLMIALGFCLIAQGLPHYIFTGPHDNLNAIYFSWQMCFGCLPVLVAVLTSFFIGTKRFGFALVAVLMASGLKLMLELPLVFGIDGLWEAQGIKGAILATAISQIFHLSILMTELFKKDNRQRFGSLNYKFKPKLFIECMKLGLPQSCGSMLNYAAWGIVVSLLSMAGQRHLMMYTIIDSVYSLLGFLTEGLQKAVLSISANLIGSGQWSHLPKLFKRALYTLIPIMIFSAIPLLFFPNLIAICFDTDMLSPQQISFACTVVWVYLAFDGISWILSGMLTGMGDTLFVNPINGITSFVAAGITYGLTTISHCQPETTCMVNLIYGLINSVLFFLLYYSRRQSVSALPACREIFTEEKRRPPPLPALPLFNAAPSKGA